MIPYEAIALILELANSGALDIDEARVMECMGEYRKQQAALNEVESWLASLPPEDC